MTVLPDPRMDRPSKPRLVTAQENEVAALEFMKNAPDIV
jgi:hypothetical protein